VGGGELLTAGLAAMLAAAVVAVTFNTIRLQVLTRAAELDVASLFGATAAYMRRPFLYFGALQGLAAGLLAVGAVEAALWGFERRIGPVLELVGLPEGFAPLSAAGAGVALGIAFGLGWLGAWLAVSRHLAPARARP
jgi:cell division transport system permease protein